MCFNDSIRMPLPRTVSQACLNKRDRLQHRLENSIRKPDEEKNYVVHFLELVTLFTFRLPSVREYSVGFERYLLEQVTDRNIDDDLTEASVINWWVPFLKSMYPLSTKGDGNCLLHSVSLAIWGCHDHSSFLRRLLYITLAGDAPEQFHSRWQREQIYQEECDRKLEINLTSMQWQVRWEDVLKTAEDRQQSTNRNAVAMEPLEAIHVFVLANILRRPIIILGEPVIRGLDGDPLAGNHLRGIFLPLLWKPAKCVRTPVVLVHHCNHFVPLLNMKDAPGVDRSEDRKHGIPLVNNELEQLPLHFLLENEEAQSMNLLPKYLDIYEMSMLIKGDSVPVLYAKFQFNDIEDDFDMMPEYLENLKTSFMMKHTNPWGPGTSHLVPPGWMNIPVESAIPLEPSAPLPSVTSELNDLSIHTAPAGPGPVPQVPQPSQAPAAVRTYPPEPNAPRTNRANSTPANRVTSTYPPTRLAPGDDDGYMSISGEPCQNPDCSFYSSIATYPYCHECSIKLKQMRKSQFIHENHANAPGTPMDRPAIQSGHDRPSTVPSGGDEVFREATTETARKLFDRQWSQSYGEDALNDLEIHRRLDPKPHSLPPSHGEIRCNAHCDCPRKARGRSDSKCHVHYHDEAFNDLHQIRHGHRDSVSRSESSSTASSSVDQSPETPGRYGQTPPFASTYPIGFSEGRVPGLLSEPTSMQRTEKCHTCDRPGSLMNHGFCQVCFNIVCLERANQSQPLHPFHRDSPPTPRLPCRTPNCLIFARPGLQGYCKVCFNALFGNNTASMNVQSRRPPTLTLKGKKCLTPGCDLFGDPSFSDLCSKCFKATKLTRRASLDAPPAESPSEDELSRSYNSTVKAVEQASRKSTGRCKNQGCENFGNSSCRGYCNGCFQSLLVEH